MSKKTSYFVGILFTIIIGTLLYWWFCCKCCSAESCEHKKGTENIIVDNPKAKEVTLNPFSVKDGDYTINIDENFNFDDSSFKILEPISENLKNSVLNLKTYFEDNNLRRLSITGLYTNDEKNNSAYPNLGLARANAVKNYFVSQGVSSRIIDTFGKLNDTMGSDENKVFFGPINFDLFTKTEGDTADDDAIKEACEALKADPLILYFRTGAAQINLTTAQRQKIAAISRCVDKLGVKALVVGHTDNTGNADDNMVLGQERADFAMSYLIRNGILSSNIESTSKGQTEPVADNNTGDGRAENRRTVVTIN